MLELPGAGGMDGNITINMLWISSPIYLWGGMIIVVKQRPLVTQLDTILGFSRYYHLCLRTLTLLLSPFVACLSSSSSLTLLPIPSSVDYPLLILLPNIT